MLSDEQFHRTRRLAARLAGIELVERHRELVARRSRRLGLRDSAGLDALLGAAEAGQTDATRQMLRLLTTKFTGFFRHPRHFELAVAHALDAAARQGRARLWSAAAATGEEAWSLAVTLFEAAGRDDPPASVLATDIDVEALAVARRGEYGASAMQAVSVARRARFFVESAPDRWSVAPAVRRLVEFRPANLAAITWPVNGPFEVIFCRNVLMYLEACHRLAVLERMASLLAPGGLLLLDPAEHPGRAGRLFASRGNGVYLLRGGPGSGHPHPPTFVSDADDPQEKKSAPDWRNRAPTAEPHP
jgi:chemotaxis protein methyltransferase CheR